MKAIILAAGNSQRLRPLTDDRNKGLIKEFDGRSLLEINYENLARVRTAVDTVIVVGGHGLPYLIRETARLQKRYRLPTTIVNNDKYQEMNNCYSLLVGLRGVDDDILIFNSDVLYHPEILTRHLSGTKSSLVIDNVEKLMPEDMKVYVEGGRIVAINKNLDIGKSYGEYIGIATIIRKDLPLLKRALEAVVTASPHLYYEDAFQLIFPETHIGVTNTGGLPWTEIDTHEDLSRARKIYAMLARAARAQPH